jgi:hypothetical protein
MGKDEELGLSTTEESTASIEPSTGKIELPPAFYVGYQTPLDSLLTIL